MDQEASIFTIGTDIAGLGQAGGAARFLKNLSPTSAALIMCLGHSETKKGLINSDQTFFKNSFDSHSLIPFREMSHDGFEPSTLTLKV